MAENKVTFCSSQCLSSHRFKERDLNGYSTTSIIESPANLWDYQWIEPL